jgi:hypothetical protein
MAHHITLGVAQEALNFLPAEAEQVSGCYPPLYQGSRWDVWRLPEE